MIKKKLFKSVKSLTAAAMVALTVMTGTGAMAVVSPVTAYAQNYTDSTGYSLRLDGDTWHCVDVNGAVNFSYDGLVNNEAGWWKVSNGEVDFGFNGLACNEAGWWKVTGGAVDFAYTGLAFDETVGWWYVNNGAVDFNFNGIANNEAGWWKVTGGAVDFAFNGLACNEAGWWKFNSGMVDFTYTGLANNEAGWWKITDGKVDFDFNGLAENEAGTWVIAGGAVDFDYTGSYDYEGKTYKVESGCVVTSAKGSDGDIAGGNNGNADTNNTVNNGVNSNENSNNSNNNTDNSNTGNTTEETKKKGMIEFVDGQWVYVVDGQIDTSYNYIAQNAAGEWWKVTNGVADIDFVGIGEKEDGTKWLFSGGEWGNWRDGSGYNCQLNTTYVGTVIIDGVAWDTNRGYVTPAKEDVAKTYYLYPDEEDFLGKKVNNNTWCHHKYILQKDGIIYELDGSKGDRNEFPAHGKLNKETNSFEYVISWCAVSFAEDWL